MRTIVVADYDPDWPIFFDQISATLWPAVHDVALAIEHVGSTAVPGLAAKPIIDIDIVIAPERNVQDLVTRLAGLGYMHLGTMGIAGRDAFRQENTLPTHNLYVCPSDSVGLHNHLALRTYLRAYPEAVRAYSDLKRRLAAAFPHDITRYVDGKTDLISAFLREAGLSQEAIGIIEQGTVSASDSEKRYADMERSWLLQPFNL